MLLLLRLLLLVLVLPPMPPLMLLLQLLLLLLAANECHLKGRRLGLGGVMHMFSMRGTGIMQERTIGAAQKYQH
jgi:hypothetical protein